MAISECRHNQHAVIFTRFQDQAHGHGHRTLEQRLGRDIGRMAYRGKGRKNGPKTVGEILRRRGDVQSIADSQIRTPDPPTPRRRENSHMVRVRSRFGELRPSNGIDESVHVVQPRNLFGLEEGRKLFIVDRGCAGMIGNSLRGHGRLSNGNSPYRFSPLPGFMQCLGPSAEIFGSLEKQNDLTYIVNIGVISDKIGQIEVEFIASGHHSANSHPMIRQLSTDGESESAALGEDHRGSFR